MKIRNTLLLFFAFSFINSISNGAENNDLVSSLIYKSNGQLIADTNFRIPRKQLIKFSKIEPKLSKQILDSLRIANVFLENGISFEVIISLTVNKHSCFSNFKIEKTTIPGTNDKKVIELCTESVKEKSDTMFFNPIQQYSCKNELRAGKKRYEKYYFPIKFECVKNKREIKNGWLYYQVPSFVYQKTEN